MPRLGKYRQKVIIEKPRRDPDDQGGSQEIFETYAERWAAVVTQGGSESRVFQQQRSETTHVVTLRYDPGILATFRIILIRNQERRVLKITGEPENVDNAGVEMRLTCSAQGEKAEA